MSKRGKFVGIYAIYNMLSGKYYVGSAIDIFGRWSVHEATLRLGKHHSYKLQASWVKHGEGAFLFEILEFCPKRELTVREQSWILRLSAYKKGYNVQPNARSSLGSRHSEETCRLMSAAALVAANTVEQKALRSERARRQHAEGNFGRKTWKVGSAKAVASAAAESCRSRMYTDEIRANMSRAGKNRWASISKDEIFRLQSSRGRKQGKGSKKREWAAKSPEERIAHGQLVREGMRLAAERRAKCRD